jgi:hypothetical protein
MSVVWTPKGPYRRAQYKNEADLENTILEVQKELFGPDRIYLDVKKKIGAKGGRRNIPDGYLIDLRSSKPRLFVVENELKRHDPLRHIALQILEFSLSFEDEPRQVRSILLGALQKRRSAKTQCEKYAEQSDIRNLDHLLDKLVFDGSFSALVIIDEIEDDLQTVLSKKFKFGVDVIELARYANRAGEHFYRFTPFLEDIDEDLEAGPRTGKQPRRRLDVGEIDTVVVPARKDGLEETFLGEDRWYAVRIHGTMRPQIRYIAVYQKAPDSAITYIAPVKSIEPWKDTGKVVLNFSEPAQEIGPIKLVKKGRVKALQNLRYTTKAMREKSKTLDYVW